MKRNPWIVSGLVIIVVLALIAGAVKFILPGVIKKEVLSAVKHSCPDCVISLKSVDIALPSTVTFNDVRFASGQGGHSLTEARMKKLTLDVSLSASNTKLLTFDSVTGEEAEVIYADGDAPKKVDSEPSSQSGMKFVVKQAGFTHALFRYVHTKNGRTSILHFHEINVEVGEIGTTDELLNKVATAHLQGQIEKSGHADLQIAALIKPGPWYVDVAIELENQNLADLNAFFTPNDGLVLSGTMVKAVAKLNTRDEKTKAHVEAIYKDADFKMKPIKDRSALETEFTNIGSALMLVKTNVDRPEKDHVAEVEVTRDPDEPLVHFLLRSAKLGLLDIAKRKL